MKVGTLMVRASLGLSITCSSVTVAAPPQSSMVDIMLRARGASIFKRSCAGCHGAEGKGGSGPVLTGKHLAAAAVQKVVTAGKPPRMPGFAKKLSADQIKATAAYVSKLRVNKKR